MKPHTTTGRGRAAFTLIELLTVIAIIAILVAMTVGIIGFAQDKASESKTQACISLIEAGIEKYIDKYGEIPVPLENTGRGIGGAVALYQALCDDGNDFMLGGDQPSQGKVGEEYLINMVAEGFVGEDQGGDRFIKDGYDRPMYYRVFDRANPDATRQDTYDLWSYGTDKTKKEEAKWIKNW